MSGPNFNITTNRAADESGAVPAGDRIAVPVVSERAILSTDTTVSTAFVNVAGGGMAQIGSWQATITTTVTSDIHIHINLPVYFTAASEAIIGYQVNSETPVTVCYENWPFVNAHGRTVVVRDILKNRAPGTYTIKAMASRNVANFTVLGPTFNRNPTMVVEAFPNSAIASDWATYTPTVTLVGGAGNTTPVYTTNVGRWVRNGNIVFCDVELSGDGGAEGAGTGQINIALPVAASTNLNNNNYRGPFGFVQNGAGVPIGRVMLLFSSGGSTVALGHITDSVFVATTGANQNNATRSIVVHFWYEVD